ncbi:MAG: hypothetical protein Ta2E_06510 [Mycoplasmoidaceae bacterium]|nr:MAG: hypothetical protein Ta2E_06510 [Mycoplasmoidaceae bacterium]
MGKANITSAKCIGCGACTSVCPVNAITMKNCKADINVKKCVGCGACTSTCPVEAIKIK